jgi:hypothetical protein
MLGVAESEFATTEKRGVYNSFLYKNAKDFLCDRISENELVPEEHFKTVKEITEYWRFGNYSDTSKRKQEYVDWLEKIDKSNKEGRNKRIGRINRKIQEQSFTKGFVDRMSKGQNTISELKRQGKFVRPDWYIDLPNLSWDEIEKRYLFQQTSNQTQSQVLPVADPE